MESLLKKTLLIAAAAPVKILLLLAATIVAIFLIGYFIPPDFSRATDPIATDTRIPIKRPIIEPDRPDLLQEP